MKNLFFLFSSALLVCLFAMIACGSKNDPPPVVALPPAYESCCGVEPVEYTKGDGYLFVPNVFTPNGDGVNDVFIPSGSNIYQFFEYEIYSATGDTLLYRKEGFSPSQFPGAGWDGNYRNGSGWATGPYKGAFKYKFNVQVEGSNQPWYIEGTACRIICDPDLTSLKDNPDCFYPVQVNTSGHLDATVSNQESACFE